MPEQIKDYTRISKSEIDGYMVHVYEWDSPAHPTEPKHAVSVTLHQVQDINVAIKTFTRDLETSMSLMDDRIMTGFDDFDEKILVYGIGDEKVLPVFDHEIRERMMADDHLRMDINPEVVVIRRFGEAVKSGKLQNDIDLAIMIAQRVDAITGSG